jgi:hypothetical protein
LLPAEYGALCRARADLAGKAFEDLVLGEQVLLDHHGFVQNGIGVVGTPWTPPLPAPT